MIQNMLTCSILKVFQHMNVKTIGLIVCNASHGDDRFRVSIAAGSIDAVHACVSVRAYACVRVRACTCRGSY